MGSEAAVEVIQRFCQTFAEGDLDDVVEFFTEDALYHNIPLDPVVGKEAIRATLAVIATGFDSIEFRLDNIAGDGSTVLTERVDIFTGPDKTISLPVMGTFEVVDGKISAWRDYFDLQQFMTQFAD